MFCVLVYEQKRVIRTRSVEYMPFSLSLSLTLSAIVWFLYGVFIKDKYVAVRNLIKKTNNLLV
jgi:solute carrier family 50 (sugar transporter)